LKPDVRRLAGFSRDGVDDRHPQEQGLKLVVLGVPTEFRDGSTTVIHKNKD